MSICVAPEGPPSRQSVARFPFDPAELRINGNEVPAVRGCQGLACLIGEAIGAHLDDLATVGPFENPGRAFRGPL